MAGAPQAVVLRVWRASFSSWAFVPQKALWQEEDVHRLLWRRRWWRLREGVSGLLAVKSAWMEAGA